MKWYNEMTEQQKQSFQKVLAVCLVAAIIILLIPIAMHFFL